MDHLVVDTNVLVAFFLESDEFHGQAQSYISGLESGDFTFHLSMLVVVEVISAIGRRAQSNKLARIARTRQSLTDWEQYGKLVLYPLDRNRMDNAMYVAERHLLRGADSVIVALAEELDMPLKTFDAEILGRFLRSSV
jgi:predicted nucleic acid-binding protein